GCPTHIKPEGDEALRLCPRCHNVTVFPAKRSTWFELFWVPLIPKTYFVRANGAKMCPKGEYFTSFMAVCYVSLVLSSGVTRSQAMASIPQNTVPPNQHGYQPEYIAQTMPKLQPLTLSTVKHCQHSVSVGNNQSVQGGQSIGCTTKISPEGDQTPRICPNCHNGESNLTSLSQNELTSYHYLIAAVASAKSKEYFEFCFVPLIPMSSKHIWRCSICQWATSIQPGYCPLPVFDGVQLDDDIVISLFFRWEPQSVTSVPMQPGGYYPPQPPPAWQGSPQNYQPGPGAPFYQGQYPKQYQGQPQGY
ncbi:LOW QUALITY PROTEIN: hypothetical protein CVT25_011822, partial [Psilocybe cyanescens]